MAAKYAASNNPIRTNQTIDRRTKRIQPITIPNNQMTISATMIQPIVDASAERGVVAITHDDTCEQARRP